MKKFNLLIHIAIGTFFFSCHSQEEQPEIPNDASISFGIKSAGYSNTRATLIDDETSADFRAKAFRVFAEHTPQGGVPEDVFNDVYVSYDGRLTGWNYPGEPKMWAENGTYVFRGFWPSSTTVEGTATTSSLVFNYSTASDKDDLMVGYYTCPTRNPDSYGNVRYVGFHFYHALAAVRVAFKIGEEAKAAYTVKNVYFTSVYRIGSFSYTQTEDAPITIDKWSPMLRAENDHLSVVRVREWKDGDEGVSGNVPVTTDDDNPQYLNLPWQLMIPQSLIVGGNTPKPGVVVEVETQMNGYTTTNKKEMTLPTPTDLDSWKPGKKYTYTITLQPNSFDITVQSVPWDVVDAVAPDVEF